MENNYSQSVDWNIHENLKSFKNCEQNIHKTSANIKNLFKHFEEEKKIERIRVFKAEVESQQLKLYNVCS